MRAAFSTLNDRIAPVFDNAPQITLVDANQGVVAERREETLPNDLLVQRVTRLSELGVETLVCGAISWPLHAMLRGSGIQVVPFVTGEVGVIVAAWLAGRVEWKALAMPGCRRHGRTVHRAGERVARPGDAGAAHGRRGHVAGRGLQARDGRPRNGEGPAGTCACPVCGQREPHGRGLPCAGLRCPVCGTAMVRES